MYLCRDYIRFIKAYGNLQKSFHQVHEPPWVVHEGLATVYEHYYVCAGLVEMVQLLWTSFPQGKNEMGIFTKGGNKQKY